jgi:FAD/FMN-containing dehydrogenase
VALCGREGRVAADRVTEFLRAGDAGYDEARRVHNGMIDKRPALVARCRSAADVVAALARAREDRLEPSVRGGGHNVAGTAVADGGLMIDLALMKRIEVDPARRRARAGAGVVWGELDRATQAHGLAVTGGMVSSTGIAGLTLGGGLGFLMGRLGLSCDNLVSAEVVLADGAVVRASSDSHPDLFWALRGGGGNFGVVTSFEYELHRVGPLVVGVQAAWPFERAGEVLRLYRELTAEGADDLTMNAALLHARDDSGAKIVGLVGCHAGALADAERDLEPVRRLAQDAVAAAIGPLPYTTINSVIDANYPRGALNYWKSRFLHALSDEAIDAMVARFATCPSRTSSFVVENLHGAVTRVATDATAVPHRDAGYNFLITSVWHDPAVSDENVSWTREAFAALEPFTEPRRYVNYVAADEPGEAAIREAFGTNYPRLARLKAAYDPSNLFHLNQNIRPDPR